MLGTLVASFVVLALTLQFLALAIFYKISKLSGMFRGSWLLTIGIAFMNVRRIWSLTLYLTAGTGALDPIGESIGLTVSVFLFAGFYEIYKASKRISQKPKTEMKQAQGETT